MPNKLNPATAVTVNGAYLGVFGTKHTKASNEHPQAFPVRFIRNKYGLSIGHASVVAGILYKRGCNND